ncbi:Ssh4p, partial [Cyberlindnera jadinii NRRL Y-1542]
TIYFTFFASNGGIFLGSSFNIPGEFDDEQGRLNDEAEYLPKLKEHEREAYFAAKQFQEHFPPQANPLGASLSEAEAALIRDRGIQSYSFEQPSEHSSVPSVIVEDKLDVRFTSAEPNSAILNNPLPLTENDTVYFEVKLFELPEDSTVSIGVATKPYPLFRLPGYNRYSMAYESTGKVRVNQPFYTPEIWDTFVEGDVIGCGFKPRSGTVFFTRNGKKVVEAAHNVKFDMYPIVGSQGPSKLDVNLGQLGYVFIEANVKKWGFGSLYGTIGIPPAYGNELGNDTVLDRGEELPPNYPSEEETFFGPPALLRASTPIEVTESSERLYERHSSTFDQENNAY